MADLTIYSARICPFAHRCRLALHEKGIDFDLVEIDLAHKPDWFAEVSPFGTVPAVRHGEAVLWESTVINEYLEETFPEPPLLSESPGERAQARIWIDFSSSRFVPLFYRLLTEQDPKRWPQLEAGLREVLEVMETRGIGRLSGEGPYWLGSKPSLVDLAFYPWFERWPVLQHYRHAGPPDGFASLDGWLSAMATRPAVRAAAQPVDFYIGGYRDYAEGRK